MSCASISLRLGLTVHHSRAATVTSNVLKEYNEMIGNTMSDLEEHLHEIDNKLRTFALQDAKLSDGDDGKLKQIQEERDSAQQCLQICQGVSEHIEKVRVNLPSDVFTASNPHRLMVEGGDVGSSPAPQHVTGSALNECTETLAATSSKLKSQFEKLDHSIEAFGSQKATSVEDRAKWEKIQEEKQSLKQCLSVCTQAAEQAEQVRVNIFEDVSSSDDAHQMIVSTLGDLISAKRITTGARSTQWLGQMADDTLQKLSQDADHTVNEAAKPQSQPVNQYEGRYGTGHRLRAKGSQASPDLSNPPDLGR